MRNFFLQKQRTIPLVSEDDMPDTLQVTVINQPVHEDHHQPVIRLEKKVSNYRMFLYLHLERSVCDFEQ